MSGPGLHVFTLKFLALKKTQFFNFFSAFKKKIFLAPKKGVNGPQKLLIIGPDPFISQASPDHSPQPRIDFSYYEILRPDICFLICGKIVMRKRFNFKANKLPMKEVTAV